MATYTNTIKNPHIKKAVMAMDRMGLQRADLYVISQTPYTCEIIVPKSERERRKRNAEFKNAVALLMLLVTVLLLISL